MQEWWHIVCGLIMIVSKVLLLVIEFYCCVDQCSFPLLCIYFISIVESLLQPLQECCWQPILTQTASSSSSGLGWLMRWALVGGWSLEKKDHTRRAIDLILLFCKRDESDPLSFKLPHMAWSLGGTACTQTLYTNYIIQYTLLYCRCRTTAGQQWSSFEPAGRNLDD